MRLTLTLVFVISISGFVGCTTISGTDDGTASAEPTPEPTLAAVSEERVATIDAKGMSCPQCASNIDRRMQKIAGVNWTKIDLGKGQVIVGLDTEKPRPTAEQLQQAVSDAGYTAGEVTLPAGEVAEQ
ncbi:MAG: heavy metal-associated domain-containing protein [Planctomycetota bacterium]